MGQTVYSIESMKPLRPKITDPGMMLWEVRIKVAKSWDTWFGTFAKYKYINTVKSFHKGYPVERLLPIGTVVDPNEWEL